MIILRYILSFLYYILFTSILLIFHPLQWIGHNLFGYNGHRRVVDLMNYLLVQSLKVLAVSTRFENDYKIPVDRPIVFVCNHQSLYDISAMASHFRNNHVKFVSKKELAKGLPSISYNLRHGGSVLIDRKDRKSALNSLVQFAMYLEKNNRSTVIFPEGTRSKDGKPKLFKRGGLQTILENTPSALIVPVTINNSWEIVKDGPFPLNLGIKIIFKIHEPIENQPSIIPDIVKDVEGIIKASIY